jgi:hypothetical protein
MNYNINIGDNIYINDKFNINFFHKYIKDNKSEIKSILSLLEKLEKLGFKKIKFCENFDFSKEEYQVEAKYKYNHEITYLENIEILPTYDKNIVSYKTSGSNYKMVLKNMFGDYFMDGGVLGEIYVNNLLFDASKLPDDINKKNFYDEIIKLKEANKKNCSTFKTSVSLSMDISDLNDIVNHIEKTIKGIDKNTDSSKLCLSLGTLKENLKELEIKVNEYNNNISSKSSNITKERIESEKIKQLSKRNNADLF